MPKGSLTESHVETKNAGQLLTSIETLLHMKSPNRDQFQWTLILEMLTNTDTPDSNGGINATEICKFSYRILKMPWRHTWSRAEQMTYRDIYIIITSYTRLPFAAWCAGFCPLRRGP